MMYPSELVHTYEMREYHWPLEVPHVKGEHTIRTIVDRLGLPESVIKSSKEILIAYKSVSGRESSPSIAAASVLMVSRDLGIPVSLHEISRALNGRITPKRIALALGEIKSVLKMTSPIPWEVYVDYVIWKVSKSDGFRAGLSKLKVQPHLIVERIRIKSRRMIVERRASLSNLMGRNPVLIAAAIVYLAAKSVGLR